jgi:dTDP-D-glucose 4,6-dehydratase
VFGENFEETRRRVPDICRAAEMLGFQAETPLEEGLRKTIAWFRHAWPRETLAPGRSDLAGFFDPSEQG